jgi:hypothetical protein
MAAIWRLSRTDMIEWTDGHRFKTEGFKIVRRQRFTHEFAGGIRRQHLHRGVFIQPCVGLDGTIHMGSAYVNNSRPYLKFAQRFEKIQRPADVDIVCQPWTFEARHHIRNGREVVDMIRSSIIQDLPQTLVIADIAIEDRHTVRKALRLAAIAAAKPETRDIVSLADQHSGKVGPDESRQTSDKCSHARRSVQDRTTWLARMCCRLRRRSSSTIISTSCSKATSGVQPNLFLP